jgi:hypothetical protein
LRGSEVYALSAGWEINGIAAENPRPPEGRSDSMIELFLHIDGADNPHFHRQQLSNTPVE